LLDVDMGLNDEALKRDGEKSEDRHEQMGKANAQGRWGAVALPQDTASDMAVLGHPLPEVNTEAT